MKPFKRPLVSVLLVVVGVGLTLADGVIHGRLTYRWVGTPTERLRAADRLEEVPDRCGDWEVVSSKPLSEYVQSILQLESHISRVYVNRQTQQHVQVAVILGPFGPTSTHTPDICYTSRDYRILRQASGSPFPPNTIRLRSCGSLRCIPIRSTRTPNAFTTAGATVVPGKRPASRAYISAAGLIFTSCRSRRP